MPEVQKASNGGFRPAELTRREFQETMASAIDRQAFALGKLQEKLKANSEFMADLSVRIDELSRAITFEEANRKLDVAGCRGRLTQHESRALWQRVKGFVFGQ